MFEKKHEKLAPRSVFIKRMFISFLMASVIILIALSIGVLGYHWIGGFNLVDSILEASMILGGMGPVNSLPTENAKLFASAYALFSGLLFIAIMGLVLAPIIHRMLHKFHIDESDIENDK